MKLRVAISTAHLAAEVSAGGGVVVLAVLARELLARLRLPAPALPQQVGLQVVEHPDRGLHVTCHVSRVTRHAASMSQLVTTCPPLSHARLLSGCGHRFTELCAIWSPEKMYYLVATKYSVNH